MESRLEWREGMAFDVFQDGHRFMLDANEGVGGQNSGPRPKGLLLSALGGCTGMDVVSILQKMRVPLQGFELVIEAGQTDEHPRVFTKIHLKYIFRGNGLPLEKLQKAVALSQERYCGVSAMLAKVAPLTYEIIVEP